MPASLDLEVLCPSQDWHVVSNSISENSELVSDLKVYKDLLNEEDDFGNIFWLHKFHLDSYVCSYIFNMCAGQFKMIKNTDPAAPVPMRFFLRDSLKDKIKAAKFFRIITTAMRTYEELTGLKYPWQKHD